MYRRGQTLSQRLNGSGTCDCISQAPLQLAVPVLSSGELEKQACEVAASGICLKIKGTLLILLPVGWNEDLMAGAQAATLQHQCHTNEG